MTDPEKPETFDNTSEILPVPVLPTVVPVMAPVILVTIQLKVLGTAGAVVNTNVGAKPLQIVFVLTEVIVGLSAAETVNVTGVPEHPEELTSFSVISALANSPKSTVIV